MNRRTFFLTGAGIGGALIFGWAVTPARPRLNAESATLPLERGEVQLNGWLKISPEGIVTIAVPRAEMGQGIYTALPMLVAEELGCDWSQVKVEQAPVDKVYGNVEMLIDGLPFHPDDKGAAREGAEWVVRKVGRELGLMITGGSSSVKDAWGPMRAAGAAARDMLVQAAAKRFNAPQEECVVANGWVIHDPRRSGSGLKASFGELAVAAAQFTPALPLKLKHPSAFTLIGKSVPRLDLRAKVTGTAEFGLDVRLPDMLYAAIRMAPVFGASWAKYYDNGAGRMPGVKAVVPLTGGSAGAQAGIAVIADTWWQAKKAVDALEIVWNSEGSNSSAGLGTDAIFRDYQAAISTGKAASVFSRGAMGEAMAQKVTDVTAEYRVPYLAHATLEPQNCTAQFMEDGSVQVWAPTQAPSIAQWLGAKAAGVKTHKVTVHSTFLGGGFGRRGEMDMVVQAVDLARQTGGLPVQLIWSREEDTTHDMYRPAALASMSAGLDGSGNLIYWQSKSASGSVLHSMSGRIGMPAIGPDKTNAEGLADRVYEIPHVKIEHALVKHPVPLGFWRSVGHSQNAFFSEHFMDEIAAKANKDPLEFRRNLLQQHPRHLAVLNLAAEKAGWGKPLAAGVARGIALHQSFGSIVAQVAEVSIVEKKVKVHRVVCAIDCGIAVHPDIIAQQMESGVVFGLTAALYGEITIEAGAVKQKNFPDYEMLRMADAPVVETHIVPSAEAPTGVGEPGTPPVAPAVANALLKLTGKPVRALPIRLA